MLEVVPQRRPLRRDSSEIRTVLIERQKVDAKAFMITRLAFALRFMLTGSLVAART